MRFNIIGKPKENLPEYEDVAYLVGFVNGHNYWLSQDKKWVIYAREDEKDPRKKHWIIGATEALGLPIEINAWLYADFKPCPEDATWDLFWDNETKQFISSSGNGNIKLECVERNDVTNKEDDWLRTMEKEEVEAKVSSSTTEDICGRRPWTNVKDYEKIYPNGHPQGFSGLLYGPDLTHRRRRGRIIDGEQANFGKILVVDSNSSNSCTSSVSLSLRFCDIIEKFTATESTKVPKALKVYTVKFLKHFYSQLEDFQPHSLYLINSDGLCR